MEERASHTPSQTRPRQVAMKCGGDAGTDHAADAYGEACAQFYDQLYGPVPADLVEALVALAGSGRVLELGSATGRIAMALQSAGLKHYVGVEASMAMIETMRIK